MGHPLCLGEGRFLLHHRRGLFTVRVGILWNSMPKEVVVPIYYCISRIYSDSEFFPFDEENCLLPHGSFCLPLDQDCRIIFDIRLLFSSLLLTVYFICPPPPHLFYVITAKAAYMGR